jgi:mannose-6-phosphate isomerase
MDALDFNASGRNKIRKELPENKVENLVSCEFFDTNIIHFNKQINRDYALIDSFVTYICTEGSFLIRWDNKSEKVTKGETVLLPAVINDVALFPEPEATLLEIYINNKGVN